MQIVGGDHFGKSGSTGFGIGGSVQNGSVGCGSVENGSVEKGRIEKRGVECGSVEWITLPLIGV